MDLRPNQENEKVVTIPLTLFDAMARVYYQAIGVNRNPDPTPKEYDPSQQKPLLELAHEMPAGFKAQGFAKKKSEAPKEPSGN